MLFILLRSPLIFFCFYLVSKVLSTVVGDFLLDRPSLFHRCLYRCLSFSFGHFSVLLGLFNFIFSIFFGFGLLLLLLFLLLLIFRTAFTNLLLLSGFFFFWLISCGNAWHQLFKLFILQLFLFLFAQLFFDKRFWFYRKYEVRVGYTITTYLLFSLRLLEYP